MNNSKKLNILHISTHLNLGGISSYLVILGTALSKRGHRVTVLSSGGQKERQLEKEGIRCFTLPIRTKSVLHPKLFFALPKLLRLLKSENFDLMHAHTRVAQVLASMASKQSGVPFVSTAHGFYKNRFGRRLMPCWGEKVVAISPLVAQELEVSHGVPKEKIAVVVNALNIEDLERCLSLQDTKKVRAEYGIPESAFVLGCVSRLVRDKGQQYLLEAMSLLTKELPEVFLLLVGDGREKKNLESLIKKYKLASRVRMISGVLDTAAVLSVTDIFLHPATYREGFGLSMAEAMVAKIPVIATRIPAIDTLLKDGEDALLVPPKNARALADAVLTLAKDSAKFKRIAASGQAMAKRVCRPERQAQEIERVYREVLSQWK